MEKLRGRQASSYEGPASSEASSPQAQDGKWENPSSTPRVLGNLMHVCSHSPAQTLGPTPPLSGFCLQCRTFPPTESPTFSQVSLLLQFGHDLVPLFGPHLHLGSRKWDGIASDGRCPEGKPRRLPTLCFELMIDRTTPAFVCLLKTSVVFNSGCPSSANVIIAVSLLSLKGQGYCWSLAFGFM